MDGKEFSSISFNRIDNYLLALLTALLFSFVFVFQTQNLDFLQRWVLGFSLLTCVCSLFTFLFSIIRGYIRHEYKKSLLEKFKKEAMEKFKPILTKISYPCGKIQGMLEVAIKENKDIHIQKILQESLKESKVVGSNLPILAEHLTENYNFHLKELNKKINSPIPGEKFSKANFFLEKFSENFKYLFFFCSMLSYLFGIFLKLTSTN